MCSDVIEIIILLFLSIFFLCYTFGMFHAWILDDWRPWKNGWKWWEPEQERGKGNEDYTGTCSSEMGT